MVKLLSSLILVSVFLGLVFVCLETEFRELIDCREELHLLKDLWDVLTVVVSTVDTWRETTWLQLDTELLDLRLKDLLKETKRLRKTVRAWPVYQKLSSSLSDLSQSLICLNELRNPAIKRRHWRQLLQVTSVALPLDDLNFMLGVLLDLNLPRFQNDINAIVDIAIKEAGVERVLENLSTTWANLKFEFPLHERTGVPSLRLPENLIDILEDNQVILQNLLSSRFITHFHQQVQDWMNNLSLVDKVCHAWADVLNIWTYLESIFAGTSDIRQQLPDDANRFDLLDSDWRALMVRHCKSFSSGC